MGKAVQVGEEPLAKIMQNMSFRYTRWVNQKQKRIGHLFQGRYKAIMVDRDAYLLELVRYIHLNPVRAKLVRQPQNYAWSGHRAYLGQEALPWLTTDWVLGQFGTRLATSRQRYVIFVSEGRNEDRRDVATLSRGVRQLGLKAMTSKVLAKRLDDFNTAIMQA
jgi:hypothetical protein